jgi:hypothetical protein
LHAKPLHETCACVAHAPAPLHDDGLCTMPPLQLADAHETVGYVHAVLAPVQLPWQVPEPVHAPRAPCGWPVVTVVHLPWALATSQA